MKKTTFRDQKNGQKRGTKNGRNGALKSGRKCAQKVVILGDFKGGKQKNVLQGKQKQIKLY